MGGIECLTCRTGQPRSSTVLFGPKRLGSVDASPAPPLRGVRQYEQVHAREKHGRERGNCQETHPVGVFVLKHSHAVENNNQRKSYGKPSVGLTKPFVQREPPLGNR